MMSQDFLNLDGLVIKSIDNQIDQIKVKAQIADEKPEYCAECKCKMVAKGKRSTVFQDIPNGLTQLSISITRNRYVCPKCGKESFATLPILNERRKCTERLVQLIKDKSLIIPFFELSKYSGVDTSLIKSIALEYAKELEETVKFKTPEIMCINRMLIGDEIHYVITNIEKKCMFNIVSASSDMAFKKYLKGLDNRRTVEWVFEDLLLPLREVLHQAFPNCKSVIHKNKVIEGLLKNIKNECYLRQIMFDSRRKDLTLRLIKILTHKRNHDLTQTDKRDLADAASIAPEFKNIFRLKEDLLQIYEQEDGITARFALSLWVEGIPKNLNLLRNFGNVLNRSLIEVINYWSVPECLQQSYADTYDSLKEIMSYVSHTHNYRIVRARLLYDDTARNITAVDSVRYGRIEYGASLNILQQRIG